MMPLFDGIDLAPDAEFLLWWAGLMVVIGLAIGAYMAARRAWRRVGVSRPRSRRKYGDRRIVPRFLWFPTRAWLEDPPSWRWLEWAWIEQKYLAPGWSLVYYWAKGPTDFHRY